MRFKKRRVIACFLLVGMVLWSVSILSTGAVAQESPKPIEIRINGNLLVTDIPPVIENGRTLIPLRAIFESLNAEVEWDPIERKVTATKGEIVIILYIGNKLASVNGLSVTLDVPPKIMNDRTLVPLRFVSEALGAEVGWDGINRIVTVISTEQGQTQDPTPEPVPEPTQSVLIPGVDFSKINLSSLPSWVVSGLQLSAVDKTYDSAKIYMDQLTVQKNVDLSTIKPQEDYNDTWVDMYRIIFWPTGCDFSPFITFQGNQDGVGGCIGRSMVHIMNVLKEREHPYTPDVSFWYLHSRQEELADGGPLDTPFVLAENGLCPEASAPSDYDKAVVKKDENGKTYVDYSEMPKPNGWTNYLASYYKMRESEAYEPTIENIRYFLKNFGPILAAGELSLIQGENPKEHHAVTVVGYNDETQVIKCLNSWGDTWGPTSDGYFTVPYADLADNFEFLRYYENISVERTGTDQAYSARIHIDMSGTSRNKLKVTIGVDGKSPFTVWDTPNETLWVDRSETLMLDVPLPIYAVDFWPPQIGTHWYVEVTNTSTIDTAELKEITLAKLYKNADGNYAIEKFQSKDTGAVIKPGETKKYYIPQKILFQVIPIKP